MPIFKPLAAAMLTVMVATPALAQAVIQEPGYCAFFYPSANCQNKGPGNPYTDPNWRRDGGGWGAGQWSNGETPYAMAPKRPPKRGSSPSPER
jgi:hypothetical protein